MTSLMWLCGGLAIVNFVFCILEVIRDNYAKATFHLIAGIWVWYIVITI